MSSHEAQREVCARFGCVWTPPSAASKVGIARTVAKGGMPIHGLRHAPKGDTNGWYIWTGELSEARDFFVPLHIEHLETWAPAALQFLGLPPGWRFMADTSGFEDVWEDGSLLHEHQR